MLTGCSDNYILKKSNTLSTINGTVYDASRSFELVSFCSASSFSTSNNVSNLNCSIGQITDVNFNHTVLNNWSCMSCVFKPEKCSIVNSSNIVDFVGLNLTSEHILGSEFDSGYVVMCCNAQGSQCYATKNTINSSSESCGLGYNELIVSSTNIVSNNWSVNVCLNGFN